MRVACGFALIRMGLFVFVWICFGLSGDLCGCVLICWGMNVASHSICMGLYGFVGDC